MIPNGRGAQGGEGPKATPSQTSPSGFLAPACSRDLKRDVAKKLEKLEKRTQRAIAELIRKCGAWQGRIPALGGEQVAQTRAPPHSFCLPPTQVRG